MANEKCKAYLTTECPPCQNFATAEERERYLGRYKPNQESFNAFIEYLFKNPGEKLTYENYRKFKKGRKKAK